MGEVHEAEDQLLGKVVALKTLNATLIGRPGAIARLKVEVALAHRVTHPSVCRIFDFGVDDRPDGPNLGAIVFLTMEYLPGETAAAFLRRATPDPGEALALLTQLAAGLAAAHEVGVVHRDLKPENVMLVPHQDRGLRAVITDFGLAGSSIVAATSSAMATRSFSGTWEYAAPERLAGRPATPASDVYSFGLIAQQFLTGRLPPVATTSAVIAAMRLGEQLGDRSAPLLGPAWDRFVLRTLHPDPPQRYQNGTELLEALRVLAPEPTPRSRPRWRPALGLVFGGVAISLGLLVAQRHRQIEPAPTNVRAPSTSIVTVDAVSPQTAPPSPPAPAAISSPVVPASAPFHQKRRTRRTPLSPELGLPSAPPLPEAHVPQPAPSEADSEPDIVRDLPSASREGSSPVGPVSDQANPISHPPSPK